MTLGQRWVYSGSRSPGRWSPQVPGGLVLEHDAVGWRVHTASSGFEPRPASWLVNWYLHPSGSFPQVGPFAGWQLRLQLTVASRILGVMEGMDSGLIPGACRLLDYSADLCRVACVVRIHSRFGRSPGNVLHGGAGITPGGTDAPGGAVRRLAFEPNVPPSGGDGQYGDAVTSPRPLGPVAEADVLPR